MSRYFWSPVFSTNNSPGSNRYASIQYRQNSYSYSYLTLSFRPWGVDQNWLTTKLAGANDTVTAQGIHDRVGVITPWCIQGTPTKRLKRKRPTTKRQDVTSQIQNIPRIKHPKCKKSHTYYK